MKTSITRATLSTRLATLLMASCFPILGLAAGTESEPRRALKQATVQDQGKASSLVLMYRNREYQARGLLQQSLRLVGGTTKLREVVRLDEGTQGFTMEVWDLPHAISKNSLGGWAQELKATLPGLYSVELNRTFRRANASAITDPGFARQWHLNPRAGQPAYGSSRLAEAWTAQSTQANSVVVAVIDDGIVAHKDLPATRVLQGQGFISKPQPGDNQPNSPINPGISCDDRPVAWHGLSISLIIAGAINGMGTVGAAPQASILPVRALTDCGGSLSDIVKAITWAAGGNVPGVPSNPTPAKVINLSLGDCEEESCPPCPTSMQQAIDTALSRSAVVVAAAGNEALVGQMGSPANCRGVISVQGHAEDGELSDFSNSARSTTISAPAGGFSDSSPLISTFIVTGSNTGNGKNPGAGSDIDIINLEGTSSATAIVSGLAALAKSLKPQLPPFTIGALMQSTAKPHPANSYCTTKARGQCAPGLMDAPALLQEVVNGGQSLSFTDSPHVTQRIKLGQTLTITTSARASLAGPVTYQWESLEKVTFQGQSTKTITVNTNRQMPYKNPIDLSFKLTVTDSAGKKYTSMYHADLFANTLKADDATYTVESSAGPRAFKLPVVAEAGLRRIELTDAPEGIQMAGTDSLDFSRVRAGRYSFSYRAFDGDEQVSNLAGIQLTVNAAPVVVDGPKPPTPGPSGSAGEGGGGGGGGLGLAGLLALAFSVGALRRQAHRETCGRTGT